MSGPAARVSLLAGHLVPKSGFKKVLRVAAIETGGQSIRVAIAELYGDPTVVKQPHNHNQCWKIVERIKFKTEDGTSEEVLGRVNSWLLSRAPFSSAGVASFGPIDLCPTSPTYGYITTTPKKGWQNTPLLKQIFKGVPPCPVKFDTDVNAAALNEAAHGDHIPPPGRDMRSCVYITVGTGVGVGVVIDGVPVHGLLHPEMGHMITPRSPGDTYEGCCPWHKKEPCVEAMVASHALEARFNVHQSQLSSVSDDHPAWDHVAFYLANLCATLVLTVSPCVIVLGGGIMNRKPLLPLVRSKVRTLLNGYISSPCVTTDLIENYIVRPRFGDDAGINGAVELARLALQPQLE